MMQQYKHNNLYVLIQGLSYLYWFLSIFKYHLIKESILKYFVLHVCVFGWEESKVIFLIKIIAKGVTSTPDDHVQNPASCAFKISSCKICAGQQLKVIPIRYIACYCNNGSCFYVKIKPLLDFLCDVF